MKHLKTLLLALICATLVALSSCGPEETPAKNYPPEPAIVKTLLFENGAWWAFEDSATGKKDTLILSSPFWGYQNAYEGDRHVYTQFTYRAYLRQSSTGRKFSIEYNSKYDAYYKNTHTPIVILNAYSVIFPPNSYIGNGNEHVLFNTIVGDTVPGGYAIINIGTVASKFLLQEKGIGISLLGKNYSEPYYKMKFLNSVAYDLKELNLWLIEKVGFAHHTLEGNYYLVDYNAKYIVP